jgi:hypothetical protein
LIVHLNRRTVMSLYLVYEPNNATLFGRSVQVAMGCP